jgi:integrase
MSGSGHIRRRGTNSFEIKYDVGTDPRTGKRRTKYVSFKGSKREARAKLVELLASVATGSHVDHSKIAVAEFVRERVNQWEASGDISARSAERYRGLIEHQIAPYIGAKLLPKLRPLDIEEWHTALRTKGRADGEGGITARTIGHAHRVLSKALSDALTNELVTKNVASTKSAPKVTEEEMVIVQDVPRFVAKLAQHERLRPLAMVALFTGMRLGEVLALRWINVDLDNAVIHVREAIERTVTHGIRFKPPKSKAGRRNITLPDILINTLREYRKSQLELRMRVGAGRLPDDALLFADIDGNLQPSNAISTIWGDFAKRIGMPEITFHALRHTHASQLIDAGVDIVTISKRLGHAKPDITLRVYAHLFRNDDRRAANAINSILGA